MMVPLLSSLAMKDTTQSETDQAKSFIVPTNLWKSIKKFYNISSEDYRVQL